MNCYDCHGDGLQTVAVAICHDCGAGVCADHTVLGTHHLTVSRVINREMAVDPPQRRIRCQTCAAALTAAGKLSTRAVTAS